MRPGELAEWFDGSVWHKIRVLVPFGCAEAVGLPGVAAVFLRLDNQTRIMLHLDGRCVEGLPA